MNNKNMKTKTTITWSPKFWKYSRKRAAILQHLSKKQGAAKITGNVLYLCYCLFVYKCLLFVLAQKLADQLLIASEKEKTKGFSFFVSYCSFFFVRKNLQTREKKT